MSISETQFDVIVIGVGSMGSSACFHLANRGIRVLGLEQFEMPHNQGSHNGKSRMIRKAYFEHPDYVPLLLRAYQLWDELDAESTSKIIYRTGGLYMGRLQETIVPGSLSSAREHNLSHRFLLHSELEDEFPEFQIPQSFHGFFEPDAGFLLPEQAIKEHVARAEAKGGRILTNTAVLNWKTSSSGVEVMTTKGQFSANQLVVTAGAWSGSILRDLGIELTVTRQVQAWFQPIGDTDPFNPENFPCWFIETDPPHGHYGFPIIPGQKGLKIAEHKPGNPIPPNQLGQPIEPPTELELNALHEVLKEYLPNAAGKLLKSCTCLYTNSPDQHFVLGKHPNNDRVTLAAGFSGHGYKFATVIGEILADLATTGTTQHPVNFLSPERFF